MKNIKVFLAFLLLFAATSCATEAPTAEPAAKSTPLDEESPTVVEAQIEDDWPSELDSCDASPLVIGRVEQGGFAWLSCGPDGRLHPQNGEPPVELDAETGLPVQKATELMPQLKDADSDMTLDNLAEYDIPALALAEVQSLIQANVTKPQKLLITEKVAESVTASQLSLARDYIAAAVNGWQAYYLPEELILVLYTKDDAAWVDEQCLKLEKRDCHYVEESKKNPMGNLGSGASSTWPHDQKSTPIIYLAFNNYSGDEVIPDILAHEWWHNLQTKYMSATPMTMWYHEGTPAFLGAATANRIYGSAGANLRYTGNGDFDPWNEGVDNERWFEFANNITADQSVEIYTRLDEIPNNKNCSDNGGPIDCRGQLAHYHMGSMATEVLVGFYGLDTFMDFVVDMPSLGWKKSFVKNFEIQPTAFYEKLAPYIQMRVNY